MFGLPNILSPDTNLTITRFESQQLLGYTIDASGAVTAKIFVGAAVFSDGSERKIFGIQNEGAPSITWDHSEGQEQPHIDRDCFGF